MKKQSTWPSLLSFFILCLLPQLAQTQQLNLSWQPRQDLNVLLPPTVRVYETNGKLADGAPVRAMYTTIDLRDKNLQLRAVGDPANRQTTKQAYDQYDAIFAINGGYFAPTSSVSLYVADGEVKAPGISKYHERFITRGAFGLVNGKPEITWTANPTGNLVYKYQQPHKASQQAPTAKAGTRWLPSQAVGGGPVLVKNRKVLDVGEIEGFGVPHRGRNPRSAIGYLNEHTLVTMVVDGRQGASAGVTTVELAQMMQELGCIDALNLDGGGSSAMVAADEVVNLPVDVPNGNRNSLRLNATALVLTELDNSPKRKITYIDTDSPYYTERGLWRDTNHANFYGATLSRQATANTHNSATYTFQSIITGKYQLATWWTVDTSTNASEVPYVLHRGQKTDTLYLHQDSFATSGRWNVLGNFILGPEDYLEVLAQGKGKKVVTDAVRLVALETFPEMPARRGDLRLAVISDLNSGLGAVTYEWQVDSIMQRIPRIWQPDLVVCGGDMVAGQGVSEVAALEKMWQGFEEHIAAPLRKAGLPFAFTLGNHDGSRSFQVEHQAAGTYWTQAQNLPALQFIDKSHFPYYYSFVHGDAFFVSWEASSPEITEENLQWLARQFATPQAQHAKFRFVLGHMPLYSVAQGRDSKGNLLNNPEKLRQLLQKYKVHTYISGHQHAYYPGKRGALELLNAGAAGSGPRSWLTLDKAPANTITLMDVFYEQDTVIYTTYTIGAEKAERMAVFDERELPAIITGENGFLLRRDVPLAEQATGTFYTTHTPQTGVGSASATIKGDMLYLSGAITDPKIKLNRRETTAGLYQGQHLQQGQLLYPLIVNARKGSFSGKIELTEDLQELLSAGALYIGLGTTQQLRAQLYPASNQAPAAVAVSSHNSRNVYAVRQTEALFKVSWEKAVDPDGDILAYTYQLARDKDFRDVIWSKPTGRETSIKLQEQDWFALMGNTAVGQPVTFYQRILTTDGRHLSTGPTSVLQLMKSTEPLEDFVEVPAPNYVFAGKIQDTGAGYGAKWDKYGKLWLASYDGTLYIQNADGSDAPFSPLTQVSVNGETYNLRTIGGMGLDADGNILIARNRTLLKIDAATGEGMAAWEVPGNGRAITSPRANEKGEIYAMSLFGEDPNYVLQQSKTQPHTFELLRTFELPGRILAREFAMAPDGLTLYFPNPGSPYIQVYSSKDGSTYDMQENISSIAAGCNAIEVGPGNTLWTAVRSSGVVPATFHVRDEQTKKMWTLPLPELNGAEARGLGVSANGDTLIFCSWDKEGGFYKYVLKKEAGTASAK